MTTCIICNEDKKLTHGSLDTCSVCYYQRKRRLLKNDTFNRTESEIEDNLRRGFDCSRAQGILRHGLSTR